MNYIMGGAGYVIANLWDVTDKDIDKLSIHCMQKLFTVSRGYDAAAEPVSAVGGTLPDSRVNDPNPDSDPDRCYSVAEALTASRDVCKLKHAVGSAPVVYGLPLLC